MYQTFGKFTFDTGIDIRSRYLKARVGSPLCVMSVVVFGQYPCTRPADSMVLSHTDSENSVELAGVQASTDMRLE